MSYIPFWSKLGIDVSVLGKGILEHALKNQPPYKDGQKPREIINHHELKYLGKDAVRASSKSSGPSLEKILQSPMQVVFLIGAIITLVMGVSFTMAGIRFA